ncbi:MAG: hypothetical protein ACI87E_000059 [Mariniblastus sp.]|jgi:hypothetical protein
MVPLITLIATLTISLLITRIGAVALTLTGMAQEAARFQARSAYTGVGFTTQESEQVVNHPVRRRVLAFLMLTGNIGVAVVIASMMATFTSGSNGSKSNQDAELWIRLLLVAVALGTLWVVTTRKWVDRSIEAIIAWALTSFTDIDVRDYVSLLHLADGYVVFEITVKEADWVADKTLAESTLSAEGVLVLGIHRDDGQYLGSPNGQTVVQVDDVLSVYGRQDRLEEIGIRKKGYQGDRAHKKAILENLEEVKQDEAEQDEAQ